MELLTEQLPLLRTTRRLETVVCAFWKSPPILTRVAMQLVALVHTAGWFGELTVQEHQTARAQCRLPPLLAGGLARLAGAHPRAAGEFAGSAESTTRPLNATLFSRDFW